MVPPLKLIFISFIKGVLLIIVVKSSILLLASSVSKLGRIHLISVFEGDISLIEKFLSKPGVINFLWNENNSLYLPLLKP